MAKVTFATENGWRPRGGGKTGEIITIGPTSSILAISVEIGDVGKAPEKGTLEDTLAEVRRIAGLHLANQMRKTISNWLAPSGPGDFGFTGKSARNIKVDYKTVDRDRGMVRLYEGTLTTANKWIREGMTPAEAGASSNHNLNLWLKWAAYRNLNYIVDIGGTSAENYGINPKKWTIKRRAISRIEDQAERQTKARHNKMNELKGIVYRVWRSIAKKGTSTWSSEGDDPQRIRMTEGRMFFNYPQKYLDDHEADLRDDVENIANGHTWRNRIQADVVNILIAAKSTALSGVNKKTLAKKGVDRWNTFGI